ncbi:hypothetical protein AJ80_09213 [Polytolypa hystricis UAMH7299]|uniref:Amino acid permease/ SLC12A domain-containing protein n=1 Tax=Polytolypa hystricis (strain UAMH7299) TaxID=1447883 RepID=A0A2B7WU86_POLH7|nr:hypothetical protein AJ80_09213 [Polytolypa hystricis UAMH7299]
MSSPSISLNNLKGDKNDLSHESSLQFGDDVDAPPSGGVVSAKYMGTMADRRDMSALGKEQVLRRNFRFISILGFGSTLIATWEVILTLLSFGLMDGGTGGLIWGFIGITSGFTLVFASIAEMASMAPTAGGQYHWVSEFAPPAGQKFLSYITGWLCAMGWQCALVAIAFLAGTIIQGLIILNNESYAYEAWHGTMLVIGITTFAILFNTFLAKKLPFVEGVILIIHVLGLFLIIIPLWVLSPIASAKDVFFTFNNGGGWNNAGTATLIGLSTTITSMIGYDCAVHMSEEIQDAGRTLPKAMMSAVGVNAILGLTMLLTLCFTLGDAESILASPTGYPFIQVFFNATKSLQATNAMVSILVITLTASAISEVATASRQLWSFARDGGLPFSSFLAHVTPGWNIPLHAVIVSLVITTLLSLINIGSEAALNAIITLALSSLMSSYMISITCVLIKRVRGEVLPPRRWSLGRYGMLINILALCFLAPMFVFVFFPLATPVDLTTMNWACVIYGGVIIIATVYYAFVGRFTYVPPVALVKREI